MLEIGRVVHAGRQHDDGRVVDALRRDRAQVVEQHVGIVLDRGHPVAHEQLGKQPHHHLAVFQHVGDAGRHAQIVLEHVKLARAGPHDVDPGDVRINAGGNVDALHRRAVLGIAQNLFRRNDARLQNVLIVIDIVQKFVEGGDALHQAGLQLGPLGGIDDPRNNVERDQPFFSGVVAVHRKGDPHALEDQFGLRSFLRDHLGRLRAKPMCELAVMRPYCCRSGIHFIIKVCHRFLLVARVLSRNVPASTVPVPPEIFYCWYESCL